jgi:hypothetical protein
MTQVYPIAIISSRPNCCGHLEYNLLYKYVVTLSI